MDPDSYDVSDTPNTSFLSIDPDSSVNPDKSSDTLSSPLYSISSHPKNSLRSTVVSYVCTTVGAGIISLPLALAEAGWVGVLIIAAVGLLCRQTADYLCAAMFVDELQPLSSYEDVGVAALGRPGKLLVSVFQNLTCYGVCCIFLIIAGGNVHALLPGVLSMHAWVLILGCALVPVSWLKTVKEIKLLAWFGLFASLMVGGVIVLKGLQTAAERSSSVSYDALRLSGFSTCINVAMFSLGSHAVIPNQVNEMHDARHSYRRFTTAAYLLISSIYILVAVCGYAGYGSACLDNVLNNIDPPTADQRTHVLTLTARAFISLHVLLAYPLPLNPVCLSLEHAVGITRMPSARQHLPRIAVRSALVFGSIFIASVVPYFGSILSLVSALSIIATAIVLPVIFYYLLYRQRRVISVREKAGMAAIVAIGIAACIIGVYYAVTGLVQEVEANPSPFDHYWG